MRVDIFFSPQYSIFSLWYSTGNTSLELAECWRINWLSGFYNCWVYRIHTENGGGVQNTRAYSHTCAQTLMPMFSWKQNWTYYIRFNQENSISVSCQTNWRNMAIVFVWLDYFSQSSSKNWGLLFSVNKPFCRVCFSSYPGLKFFSSTSRDIGIKV